MELNFRRKESSCVIVICLYEECYWVVLGKGWYFSRCVFIVEYE